MQIDGQVGLGTGLVLGGGTLAVAARPVANRIYRQQYGVLRDVVERAAPLTAEQFTAHIATFDRNVGRPLVIAAGAAMLIGSVAALGGAALLGHHLRSGGED